MEKVEEEKNLHRHWHIIVVLELSSTSKRRHRVSTTVTDSGNFGTKSCHCGHQGTVD